MGSEAAGATSLLSSHALAWCVLACLVVAVAVVALLMRRRLQDANTQLEKLRGRDALTGLPTRADFDLALEASARRCDRGDMPVALLLIGLDGLRQVNEGYGHQVGDALLVEAARRLQGPPASAMGASGLARLGGDEFALIVPAAQATALADALRQLLHRPYRVAGVELQLTASVGVAVYPEHGARTRLLGHAALAMRSVKLVGGGSHAVFHSSMGADQRDQAELVQDLRLAIEKRQLQLYYQPKVDARSLQITGAEALLRWQHPARGMVGPAVFVPLAERHGLIVSIGRWVVEEATRQAAAWRDTGLRMRVAVNVSGLQLRQPELVPHLLAHLRRHDIPPSRFTCEITESVAIEDSTQARQAFQRLREAGLHVSIDDFGTGHSSLATLRQLPAAEIKIDRAFVSDLDAPLEVSEPALHIVQTVVRLARSLGQRVVAEGVETEAQRDALVALGVDELQGYLFAKPMTAASLALWASEDNGVGGSGGGSGPSGARTSPVAAFRASLFAETAPAELTEGAPAPGPGAKRRGWPRA